MKQDYLVLNHGDFMGIPVELEKTLDRYLSTPYLGPDASGGDLQLSEELGLGLKTWWV